MNQLAEQTEFQDETVAEALANSQPEESDSDDGFEIEEATKILHDEDYNVKLGISIVLQQEEVIRKAEKIYPRKNQRGKTRLGTVLVFN